MTNGQLIVGLTLFDLNLVLGICLYRFIVLKCLHLKFNPKKVLLLVLVLPSASSLLYALQWAHYDCQSQGGTENMGVAVLHRL